MNRALTRLVPAVFVARRQNQLGFRVGSEEFGDESASGKVGHSLTVAQQLVPLFFLEWLALAFEFGQKGGAPQVDVGWVLE